MHFLRHEIVNVREILCRKRYCKMQFPRKSIFVACHDNLKGLSDAISTVFPRTKSQLCIVHQIRNSVKFVPYKDRKAVCADLKKVYGAVNLDDAEYALEEFREKWNSKYPAILRSWDSNWTELTTFFAYPGEIRHLIDFLGN